MIKRHLIVTRRLLVMTIALVMVLSATASRAKDWRKATREIYRTRSASLLHHLPALTGEHRALIILAAFADKDFSSSDAQAVWNDIANRPGYDEHGAAGSVSDYFAEQSGGKFRISFDVVGPVKLPEPYAFYGGNVGEQDEHPQQMIVDACLAVDGEVDFSHYDWNGDGEVEMVFVLYAGMGENDGGDSDTVWPHMYYLYGKSLRLDGVVVNTYACANEVAGDGTSLSGLGTICHEFSHCLGLPDMYENTGEPVLDEWELMDGGNYANNGWCPPNYSAYEKYLCGWLEPEELTAPATITAMASSAEEGKAYLIRSNSDAREFYILENRQWSGWDTYLPGHGLLITHITNHTTTWANFPNTTSHHSINYVFADGLDYKASEKASSQRYNAEGRSNYLSGAAYPYMANDALTADSHPRNTLGKDITDIKEDGGCISFKYMGGEPSGISSPADAPRPVSVYDLNGRSLSVESLSSAPPSVYLVRYSDGTVRKVLVR